MATQAHCAYCFEALAASFERRQPLPLEQVEDLWERYHASSSKPAGENAEEEEEDDDDECEDIEGDAEMTDAEEEPSAAARPAAISRLLNRKTTSSSAGSSSRSLPSMASSGSSGSQSASASESATPASSSSSLGLGVVAKRRGAGESHPLFVTWNTLSRTGKRRLRGCIGTFEAQELGYGLRSYALTSAFEDTRFRPISSSLLPSLACHVTLLTNFSAPTNDPMDWTLGKHGIRISFTVQGRRYGSTYLPDVAKEQEWTKDETLVSLMRKAGWNGNTGSWSKTWRDGKGELIRYEGKQVALEFDAWREWRDWVNERGVESRRLN